jgi:hypothetical protein
MYEFEIVFPKGKTWVYADDETKARTIADHLGYVPIISIKQVSTSDFVE